MITSINLRVYGIFVNDKQQVLVSDERIRHNNLEVTKFPGGGLEPGEGTIDCIQRECKEEMGISISVTDHLYTTDFFQQSAFNESHQLISIYYLIQPMKPLHMPVNNGKPVYPDNVAESFRFIDWNYFTEDCMTLPVDKIAAKILKQRFIC